MSKSVRQEIIINICLALFFLLFLSPIIIELSGSFRPLKDSSSYLNLFQNFSLESYGLAFDKMNYFRSLKNSVLITFISAVLLLLFLSLIHI